MIKTIPVKKLSVGMYVILPKGWFKHAFAKSEFIIRSKAQIRKLQASGFDEVKMDTEKSLITMEPALPSDVSPTEGQREPGETKGTPADEKFDPIELIANDLVETITSDQLEPREKATAVYSHCIDIMDILLEQPTAHNIHKTKQVIATIVDFVLVDDETAGNLSGISNHEDYYTYTHSVNVGLLSVLLAKELLGSDTESHNMRELGAGFFLHDLGKCNVSTTLFNKRGLFTDEEMRQMRLHPGYGYEILHKAKQLSNECKSIVLQHHEREDGTGYPYGLKGNEIHLYGRICRIADVYDALTSRRSYRAELPPFKALRIMKEEMINQFNREIFNEFVHLLGNN